MFRWDPKCTLDTPKTQNPEPLGIFSETGPKVPFGPRGPESANPRGSRAPPAGSKPAGLPLVFSRWFLSLFFFVKFQNQRAAGYRWLPAGDQRGQKNRWLAESFLSKFAKPADVSFVKEGN